MSWLRSPVSDAAGRAAVESRLDAVEDVLARRPEGPFVLGKFSIVECHLAGILERVAASSAYFKGFFVRSTPSDRSAGQRWPMIQQWFSALEARPAFRSLCGDFFTHSHDLPPQLGTCAPNGKGAACAEYIDDCPVAALGSCPCPLKTPSRRCRFRWAWLNKTMGLQHPRLPRSLRGWRRLLQSCGTTTR